MESIAERILYICSTVYWYKSLIKNRQP